MSKLFSFVIPTHNSEKTILRLLLSINRSSFKYSKSIEVIIIDDNSTDDTQQFCKNLSNIKYIHLEESSNSVSIPRNIGISHSTGKYIAHVDDDVFCLPNKFDVLVNCLENDNKLSLAYGNRVNCNCSVINDEIIIINMEEKIKVQRNIKDLEKKRNEMRQKLYQSQDEVDVKKEGLLDRIESQLDQKISLKTLFTIRFKII